VWLILFLLLPFFSPAQTPPVCNTPANGSDWHYFGPTTTPALGPGARPAHTGTGAQIRLKLVNPDEPNPQTLYACTPTGGLFRSRNVLDSMPVWENLTDSTRLPVLGVQDVEFMPGNPDVIFIGTGIRYPLDLRRLYGIGMLKSTDGGRNWNRTGLTFNPPGAINEVCHDILINPDNPNVIHALCGPRYYKSVDGGKTFKLKKVHTYPCPVGWAAFRDMALKPGDPNVLYLTSDGSQFYASNDEGETWEELNVSGLGVKEEVQKMDIAVSRHNPDLIYLGCKLKKNEVILRSLDGGTGWEVVFDKYINTSFEKHAFEISPNHDTVLYLGGMHIYQMNISNENSKSKVIGGRALHLDHRDIVVAAGGRGSDILYSGNDGGLYSGTFNGNDWELTDISGYGMNNMMFYGIGVAEDFSVVPGGTQDLGIMLIYPDSTAVKPNIGGDGTDCAVDLYDPNYIYGITWSLGPPQFRRSTNKGLKWSSTFQRGLDPRGDPYYYQLATHENGYVYAGTKNAFKLPHKGGTWEQIGDLNLPNDLPWKVTALTIAPSDANIIYAIGDKLYKTENANAPAGEAVWTKVYENMGDAANREIAGGRQAVVEVDPANPDKVWVGFRSFDSEYKVCFSGDGGSTWSNVSAGLPPFPVNALAFQAGTDDALYAGTDVGMYYNPRASGPNSEWLCFNHGLPVCLISDLEMNYCRSTIVAGTYGRGIWASPFAAQSDFKTVEIKGSTTWNFKILRSDVVVTKGHTLTLTGEIRVATGRKIVVEKNAKLILDGAQVKALCGEPWQGIETLKAPGGLLGWLFGGKDGTVELRNGAAVFDNP
jgi:hypothetical protein